MPAVGISKDRQMLRGLNYVLDDVTTKICFGCAQKQTHVPLWEGMYAPGQHGLRQDADGRTWSEHQYFHEKQSSISMYSIARSLQKFKNRNERRFLQHFCYEKFKQRYASEDCEGGNPFQELLVAQEREWVREVRLELLRHASLELRSVGVQQAEHDDPCAHEGDPLAKRLGDLGHADPSS